MLEAADQVDRYTSGQTFQSFSADSRTIDAVVHNMQIIGEAAGHVPDDVQHRYPHVPWSEMRRMRNLLVHVYFGTDVTVVWQTLTEDLPPLKSMLQAILAQEQE